MTTVTTRRLTVSGNVELWPEAAAVGGHGLGVAVELAHGEGVVGLELVSLWEGVHAVGLVRVRHTLHLVDLDGHAGGFVGRQAGAVLVWSGDGAAGQAVTTSADWLTTH